jgi:uncharacterized protein
MSTDIKPTFRELDRGEMYTLLARNNVGRVAYARGSRIDIEPMHYVYSDGWIYGRTSRGNKLKMVGESWWPVAFEVDEVVHGGFYTLSEDGAAWERAERERAIELLRQLTPEALTDADPTPFRSVVFRIAVQEVSGRAASLGATGAAAAHG